MRGTAAAASAADSADISFWVPLASAPAAHFIPAGAAPPPQCPGTAGAPKATAGNLCIFEGTDVNMTALSFQDPVSGAAGTVVRPFGAIVVGLSAAAGSYLSSGSWAVTAP
jgi:hypothetical protein